MLKGHDGKDILIGAKGKDYLDGSKGKDVLFGGKAQIYSRFPGELTSLRISTLSKATVLD